MKNLKRKFLLLLIITTVLILLYYYTNLGNDKKTVVIHEQEMKANSHLKDNENTIEKQIPVIIDKPTESIWQLNTSLGKSGLGVSSIDTEEFYEFANSTRDSTKDVLSKIQLVIENQPDNFAFLNTMFRKCKVVNKKIEQIEVSIDTINSENIYNYYYFLKGIKESRVCEKFVDELDPFYLYLKIARNGHELAQFRLLDELFSAVTRNVINIKIHPREYEVYRDEAIMYLKQLSTKGLYHASEKLAIAYRGTYVPEDLVLEYYFAYLTELQNTEYKNILQLGEKYNRLTDSQQKIADRMTSRL